MSNDFITKSIIVNSIGVIYTPHTTIENMPIQPVGADGVKGVIELNPDLTEGLADLDGFSHLILIYHLHEVDGFKLTVKPFMDDKMHGVFATRSPKRPNAIGISTVKLVQVTDNKIHFEGADMLNETPLIDIKPFFRQTDNRTDAVSGWLDEKDERKAHNHRSDDRFK
ncbi:tRNA (N6-threonylcarbamoyladenosine(37)-N6)-methyltransferase TrmO [Sunxiuqinia indica]|uniref:tRNA (N6-threonylcarbamoyladenosine(37)-N6)-methyltransferase TrmO n=1 Tax=Sunxiuqinia indica TaxID=2692584 RepID=UPI00135AA144|nr:tRNA (N6-threonylcarbamoyladenosine(37)-N6)-methyltransferase TrmO [Sunxiuqinia indica]